jgi:hypothetical protein
MDGLHYRAQCPDCHQTTYDCLPWKQCHNCESDTVEVTFEAVKRAAELLRLTTNERNQT